MGDPEPPSFDLFGQKEESASQLQEAATETIDLSDLFARDVYASGTFDLSAISSSTFGRLLDALPIPALLIDQCYQVGFANQSCEKISANYRKIRGAPFTDLVPLPSDPHRAQALSDKTLGLIKRAYETRKPQVAEAILEIENKRIWARLHLRSVRIGLERYVLLIIGDLTFEKKQLVLSQRNDEKYRKANFELGKRMDELTAEVQRLNEEVRLEMARGVLAQELLRQQQQKYDALWNGAPSGLAVIGHAGFVQRVNHKFSEMFGYEVTDLANNTDWIVGLGQSGAKPVFHSVSDWIDALGVDNEHASINRRIEVRRRDGRAKSVNLTATTTVNEEFLLIFDSADDEREH